MGKGRGDRGEEGGMRWVKEEEVGGEEGGMRWVKEEEVGERKGA